jgi:enamine deaminase RidA (YjgF/YER057c/UK114 family)
MKFHAPLLFLLVASFAAAADLPPPKTEKYQAGPWEDEYGYRAAVRVGDTLHISGVTGKGPVPDAVKHVYTVLGKILARHGLNFSHVVKETVFTTDLDALKAAKDVRLPFYRGDYPAASWIGVSRLFQPDYVIEVELTAQFPDAPASDVAVAEITASLNEFLAQNADPAQHDRFWADDLVYTSSAAKVQGKADIMKSMRESTAKSASEPRAVYSAENIVVRPYDGFAALNFRLVAKNPDGTTNYYRNSGTLVRRAGRWQVVTWQATREPEAKPTG